MTVATKKRTATGNRHRHRGRAPRARSLEIVDSEGRPRIHLGVATHVGLDKRKVEDPCVELFDAKGTLRLNLQIDSTFTLGGLAYVAFFDGVHEAARLSVDLGGDDPDGATITVSDEDGMIVKSAVFQAAAALKPLES